MARHGLIFGENEATRGWWSSDTIWDLICKILAVVADAETTALLQIIISTNCEADGFLAVADEQTTNPKTVLK